MRRLSRLLWRVGLLCVAGLALATSINVNRARAAITYCEPYYINGELWCGFECEDGHFCCNPCSAWGDP